MHDISINLNLLIIDVPSLTNKIERFFEISIIGKESTRVRSQMFVHKYLRRYILYNCFCNNLSFHLFCFYND